MTNEQKKHVKWKLENYVATFPSQKQAANSLKDISEAHLINILKENWDRVSEETFRNILNQMDRVSSKTQLVETTNFMTLILYFSLAKENGATFAISGGAGFGKSYAGKFYSSANRERHVYYLECAEYWNKKMFLSNILQAMGKQFMGMNIGEMMLTIVTELRRQNQPLIILDEVDKLPDPVLKFFITLYNELNGACGFVWTSTNNIEKRITRGLNQNRNGYQELFSRIGQRFIILPMASAKDITEICYANGISEQEDISKIINECNGDLRRVERNFLKKKAKDKSKQLKAA